LSRHKPIAGEHCDSLRFALSGRDQVDANGE
jgi:hypothetical protein